MGRAVVRLAAGRGIEVVSALGATDLGSDAGELAGAGKLGVLVSSDMAAIAANKADVVIDFSSASAVPGMCEVAARARIAIVSGTTGLDDVQRAALASAARAVPVLWEPNMSIGVHVLGVLVERAIAMLGPGFDVEIVEAHHNQKADAPSGTAVRLAEIAKRARTGAELVHGRSGRPGARPKSEIGVHAVRGGDVIGDHTVHLMGQGERLELTHRASSRDLFAHGAIRAAEWLSGKPAGTYRLADLLS